MDGELGDELLGLIFTFCHSMLSPDARAALTLRVVGRLTTDEIARAFLLNEAAIAQRIVRAKKATRLLLLFPCDSEDDATEQRMLLR
jgi:predicted RNA polymerase sigma factor